MGTTKHSKLLSRVQARRDTPLLSTRRRHLQPVLITGMEKGGQLTTTTEVENWLAIQTI